MSDPDSAGAGDGPALERRAFLTTVTAGAVGLSGCTGDVRPFVGQRETNEDTATGVRSLLVDADVGDVTVVPNEDRSAETVFARVAKRSSSILGSLSSASFSMTATDGRAEVRVETDDGSVLGSAPNVTLRVEAHPSVVVERVRSTNGDVLVEDLDGPGAGGGESSADASTGDALSVESTNGDATARGTGGDVEVSSTNGDATAAGVDGFARAETTNGDVRIEGCDGLLGVTSENGDVTAAVTALRGDADVRTRNGDARATLDESLDARVVGETSRGDLNVSLSLNDADLSENRVTGTVGDGGPTLRVSSENGDVTLA